MKARYRNKLNKIIVELEYQGKWYYIKTLPPPQLLFEKECLDKVSQLEAQKQILGDINSQGVPTTLITRTQEKDTKEGNLNGAK